MDEEITLRATYLRPEGNASGTFLIAREDVATFDAWRTANGVRTVVTTMRDPVSGEELPAYRPVEKGHLFHVEEEKHIRHGQGCRVRYRVKSRGGQPSMYFIDAEPE